MDTPDSTPQKYFWGEKSPVTKRCRRCNAVKPLEEFKKRFAKHRSRWYRNSYCRACCHKQAEDFRATWTPERQKEYDLRRNKNKRRIEQKWLANIKANYGLSKADYLIMLNRQGGVCAICKRKCEVRRYLSVDHCHATGKIRGLLCSKCNHVIGLARESPEILKAAIEYLAATK